MASPPLLRTLPLRHLRLLQHHHFFRWNVGPTTSPSLSHTSTHSNLTPKEPPSLCRFFSSMASEDELFHLRMANHFSKVSRRKAQEAKILEEIELTICLVKDILYSNRYMNGERLNPDDEKIVVDKLLAHHPNLDELIGCGADSITVGAHPRFRYLRCLFVVRTDGGWIDFSYQSCLQDYIRFRYPSYAERFIKESNSLAQLFSRRIAKNANSDLRLVERFSESERTADHFSNVCRRKTKEAEILEEIELTICLVKDILYSNRYMNGERLNPDDEKIVVDKLLAHHPNLDELIGCGADSIIVGPHPRFRDFRCLFVVRTDGECIYFSYQNCLQDYIRYKCPSDGEKIIKESNSLAQLFSSRIAKSANSDQRLVKCFLESERCKAKEGEILDDIEITICLLYEILHSNRYTDGDRLSPDDETAVVDKLLAHHPHLEDLIGCEIHSIIVDKHQQSRGIFVVRTDGECIDISYRNCLQAYIRHKFPSHAERFIKESPLLAQLFRGNPSSLYPR